jgi:hypothetical protein
MCITSPVEVEMHAISPTTCQQLPEHLRASVADYTVQPQITSFDVDFVSHACPQIQDLPPPTTVFMYDVSIERQKSAGAKGEALDAAVSAEKQLGSTRGRHPVACPAASGFAWLPDAA